MEFTRQIPDAAWERIKNAFAKVYRYKDMIRNPSFNPNEPEDSVTNPLYIANNETIGKLVEEVFEQFIQDVVYKAEKDNIIGASKDSLIQDIKTNITLS
jgi:hypothetical protein